MQMLIDFLPLLRSLLAYKLKGIYAATIVLMVALPLIPLGQKLLGKKVSQVHLWSAALVLVFGSATLLLRDPRFIMWKPTVLYVALAVALTVFDRYSDRGLLERAMGGTIAMSKSDWRTLGGFWVGFFLFLGALNIWVAYNYTESTWFSFKVWGLTGLTIVFIVAQALWIAPRAEDVEAAAETEED